jgi:capsid protein
LLARTNPKLQVPVKLDIRLVEADQISTPGWFDGLNENAVDGIKFDNYGNPSEYHELPYHPGDSRGFLKSLYDYGRLSPDDVIHLYNHERPGQARGIPEVTPALPLFAMARRYTLATVLAAETAADFVAILQTQANAFNCEAETATPQNPFESVDIDRGLMTALPYGYELSQLKAEQPTTTYVEYRNALLQEIARCIHMPTNKARGDSSGYNYSSARLDHQIYYHAIDCERVDWENECLDRIFGWWFAEARLATPELFFGLPSIFDLDHVWTWKPASSVNPKQDAETAIALRDAGLLTERRYLTEGGIDPESHWAEVVSEMQRRAAWLREMAAAQRPPVPQPPSRDDDDSSEQDDEDQSEADDVDVDDLDTM